MVLKSFGPNGIGIHGGNLFVCDTGNHRLSIFSLRGFVLRAIWTPPPDAELALPWEPYAVTFDRKGIIFVTDRANGYIHRFTPRGEWLEPIKGLNSPTHITIDRQDRLYVVVEGQGKEVRVLDRSGKSLPTVSRPEEVASYFPSLPFQVDAQGNLHLTELCLNKPGKAECSDSKLRGVFDLQGTALKEVKQSRLPSFETDGFYVSEPLDSKIYRCQWHRVVLTGKVPAGTRIVVSTFTVETELTRDYVAGLSQETWQTGQAVRKMESEEWDCLIQSGAGRFLWLRLQLMGDGFTSPVIDSVRIEFPRISLRRYLPAVFGQDPQSADFTDRFLSIFDTTLRTIEYQIDNQALYFDPRSSPATPDPKTGVDFLSWLASWIGLNIDRHWPEAKRREFLKRAARLYHIRGTRVGLWRQLLFFLGIEGYPKSSLDNRPATSCSARASKCHPVATSPCPWQPPPLILEHYQLRRWLFVGAGRLGDQAVLWGKRIVNRSQLNENTQVGGSKLITTQDPYRDPFHVYAHKFSVFVPACYGHSERERRSLANLIDSEKPAHTVFNLEYVGPRFRIGFQSVIGFDSVVGRYPEGINLDESRLGRASVLGEPSYKRGSPSLEIGKEARIGTTTKLN
jgi:phage tail-like protein